MSLPEYVALAVLLAGFAVGVALVVWGLLDDGGDDHRGPGPGDEPEPAPTPASSGRRLTGVAG